MGNQRNTGTSFGNYYTCKIFDYML